MECEIHSSSFYKTITFRHSNCSVRESHAAQHKDAILVIYCANIFIILQYVCECVYGGWYIIWYTYCFYFKLVALGIWLHHVMKNSMIRTRRTFVSPKNPQARKNVSVSGYLTRKYQRWPFANQSSSSKDFVCNLQFCLIPFFWYKKRHFRYFQRKTTQRKHLQTKKYKKERLYVFNLLSVFDEKKNGKLFFCIYLCLC